MGSRSKTDTARKRAGRRLAGRRQRQLRVLLALRQVHEVIRASHRFVELRTGLPVATTRVLARVAERPGISASQLASDLGLHRSTASNVLRMLADNRWVTKRRAASDQRAVCVSLTAAGRQIVRRGGANARGILSTLTETLTDQELRQVESGLEPVTRRLAVLRRRPAAGA